MKQLLVLIACLCVSSVSASVSLVPKPVSVEEKGTFATLPATLRVFAGDSGLQSLAREWIALLRKPYEPGVHTTENGYRRIVSETALPEMALTPKPKNADIRLAVDKNLDPEAYDLTIASGGGIVIRGGSTAGVWWGLQTLSQILIQSANEYTGEKSLRVPELRIADKPLFAYRGAMLDCARHFFSVDDVKKFIDIMSLHKLNTFHWHLTDDQGWRIEIKKYPRLTEIGSVRSQTLIGHIQKSKEYDGKPYGGFYTQEQIRDVVAYAAARQVTIIPEIEMPGHSQAALAAYPHLGCKGEGYEVRTTWGISKEVVCLGNDDTYAFFRDVLDEVAALFPGEIIHIGGDEAKSDNWQECPKCQAKIKALGLESERHLQGDLVARMEEHLKTKGKRILGWDEILTGGVTPGAIVMSWRGPSGGIQAASMGNDVVMAPNTHFYLDYYQTDDPVKNNEPLAIGRSLPIETCYAFEPFDQLDDYTKKHILGIQANLWAEYIDTFDKAQFMLFPRLAALSEIAWSEKKEDFDSFFSRVRYGFVPVYQYYGWIYAPYAFNKPNFDEGLIHSHPLPDVLAREHGKPVATAAQWEKERRPELLSVFEREMYGSLPVGDVELIPTCLEERADALGGKATRKQVELTFRRNGIERKALLLIYLPNGVRGKAPCFLGFNFRGNHTISTDPVVIASQYPADTIGSASSRWDVEAIIDAGYGLVTAHYYDFFYDKEDGDFEGKYAKSMLALFGKDSSADCAEHEGRAISTWAWGYSRVLDYLAAHENRINPEKVAVMGHSRLGKTALWAGANDQRFALVISNDSGCCGAALSKRRFGEDIRRISRFRHWFCKSFDRYVDNEESMPFDQHELLALIAPRALYVASAVEDVWADPRGEFLSAVESSRVYGLYGLRGIEMNEGRQPEVNIPINDGMVGYHVREGKHTVTSFDWKCFISFADRHLK